MRIIAAIDWEFTYAAPAEFSHSPLWWLLLELPEEWPRQIANWKATYEPRLETFLRVLKHQDDTAIANGSLMDEQWLSERTRESWERGDFWVNYGTRKSWALDAVWPMMEEKFFFFLAKDLPRMVKRK